MHVVFALPEAAETGGGGGADYIDGLAGGLRQNEIRVDVLKGRAPAFPASATPVIDGMLLPALLDRIDELAAADAVVLVHHVAAAAGRDDGSRERVRQIEHAMLTRLRRVVATSQPVADRLRTEFGVAARAVPPGTRLCAVAAPEPGAPHILSVGVLTRRKGHDRLLRAAARLTDLPWHLVIAGDANREPDFPAELGALIGALGLDDRVSLLADPAPDDLEREWRRASLFALATTWEGYPAAVAEAMQRGIPCVVTEAANAGAILSPEAGAICPTNDMATFGKCLRRLLFDSALHADMAAAARTTGQSLPRWPDRAREFQALLECWP